MTQDNPTKAVATIIKSKAKTDRGWTIEMDIQEISRNYPTKVYGVDDTEAAKVEPGEAHNIVLKRDNLRKDRDGNQKEGKYPSDYFYAWVGLASDGGVVESAAEGRRPDDPPDEDFLDPPSPFRRPTQQQQPAQQQGNGLSLDERIAWNSAINNAAHEISREGYEVDLIGAVEALAIKFYHLIRQGPPQESPVDNATSDVQATQTAETPNAPGIKNAGAFMNAVQAKWSSLSASGVKAKLGINLLTDIPNFDKAWLRLVEIMEAEGAV